MYLPLCQSWVFPRKKYFLLSGGKLWKYQGQNWKKCRAERGLLFQRKKSRFVVTDLTLVSLSCLLGHQRLSFNVKYSSDLTPYHTLWFAVEDL